MIQVSRSERGIDRVVVVFFGETFYDLSERSIVVFTVAVRPWN